MQKKNILIIEDSRDLAYQLQLRLEHTGYSVEIADDGNEGLRKARSHHPDLILLDIMLPGMDGYRICRLLKFDQQYERIPIIILTARSLDQDRELAAETGANAYLIKPFDWAELQKTVENLLDGKKKMLDVKPLCAPDDENAPDTAV